MNYGAIKKTDIANGEGVRVSLFVSGCRHHCKGCFNQEAWDFSYGQAFTYDTINEILDAMDHPYIKGLSILGGEPLDPANIQWVETLIFCVRSKFGADKDIWVYTGYTYEEVKDLDLLHWVDVLVDGPFIEEQKDISLRFRGSRNQRIIRLDKMRSAIYGG